jgi:hypothetical protein
MAKTVKEDKLSFRLPKILYRSEFKFFAAPIETSSGAC